MGIEAAFHIAAVVLLFATLIVAATTDLLHRKVYNWLTFPAIIFGLTLAYAAGGLGSFQLSAVGGQGLLDHLAGLGLGFGVFFLVYWGNGVGGGDVKLVAAVGAVMGFQFIIGAMFWSGLVGAIMAVWVLIWRGKLSKGMRRSLRYAMSLRREEPKEDDLAAVRVPYGVAIAFGTMVAWFLTELPQA